MSPTPERTKTSGSSGPDDAVLVRAACDGDEAAFADIVHRYQRAVYRVAYGLTRNAEDADDLTQETFIRAHRALDTFRQGEPLYPWLSRIAVNLAYSLFRRRRRRPETPLEPLVEAGVQWAGDDDPVEEVAEREQASQIRARFAELKPEHQAILVLRVVQGMTYEDIASSLHVPVGTVMSRLSRARAELRERLERSRMGSRGVEP